MKQEETITIVSGLPRSGTSMMMKVLETGGMQLLTDNIRKSDQDNPKGYYEYERVKKIKDDTQWLPQAQGKAVKMISVLLKHLPNEYEYKIIFIQRKMAEILASQKKMLIRRGEPTDKVSDSEMAQLYEKHLKGVKDWLKAQHNMDVLYTDYNQIISNPAPYIKEINGFLNADLDTEKMMSVIDGSLYRQRR